MKKIFIFGILGVVLLVGLVIAIDSPVEDDIVIDLSTEDIGTLEDRNITDLNYTHDLDFEKGVAMITRNKERGDTFTFIKEVEIRPYTDECVSWNVSFITEGGVEVSSIESIVDFDQAPSVQAICVSNPRVN